MNWDDPPSSWCFQSTNGQLVVWRVGGLDSCWIPLNERDWDSYGYPIKSQTTGPPQTINLSSVDICVQKKNQVREALRIETNHDGTYKLLFVQMTFCWSFFHHILNVGKWYGKSLKCSNCWLRTLSLVWPNLFCADQMEVQFLECHLLPSGPMSVIFTPF